MANIDVWTINIHNAIHNASLHHPLLNPIDIMQIFHEALYTTLITEKTKYCHYDSLTLPISIPVDKLHTLLRTWFLNTRNSLYHHTVYSTSTWWVELRTIYVASLTFRKVPRQDPNSPVQSKGTHTNCPGCTYTPWHVGSLLILSDVGDWLTVIMTDCMFVSYVPGYVTCMLCYATHCTVRVPTWTVAF